MAKSKFTPEMDELLILSYQNHVKPKEIAAKLGLTTRAVCDRASYLKRRGALPKPETEDAETDKPDEPESTTAEPVEENTADVERLRTTVTELMDERDKLLKANYALREGFDAAASTVEELKNELRAVKESGSEILERLTQKRTELLDEAKRIETAIDMIGKYGENM